MAARDDRYRDLFDAMGAGFLELDFSRVNDILRALRAEGVTDLVSHIRANPATVERMIAATIVVDFNPRACALMGDGGMGSLAGPATPYWPRESRSVYAESAIAALQGKRTFNAETRLSRRDGRIFDAQFTAGFPSDPGRENRMLIGVQDISARVHATVQLARAQSDLAHAARLSMLGEVTASIAHEVNQPLAAIVAYGGAALRWLSRVEPDVAEAHAALTRIIDDSRRAADIIARTRAMAANQPGERHAQAINTVVEEAAAFLRHEFRARGAVIELDLEQTLPTVAIDRIQIQQVMVNLMMNALQAQTDVAACRVRIETRFVEGMVALTIDDWGPGIAADALDKLFAGFFTTKATGMGVGLAICRSIVESHGGRILAANRDEGGARLRFTLPPSAP